MGTSSSGPGAGRPCTAGTVTSSYPLWVLHMQREQIREQIWQYITKECQKMKQLIWAGWILQGQQHNSTSSQKYAKRGQGRGGGGRAYTAGTVTS